MIQMHLSSVQIQWMMFVRILMITIQSEKGKKLIVFDDMIADIMANEQFQAIIEDMFIRCRKLKINFTCFYHTVLCFCSKLCKIKFNTLFDYENKQQSRITKYCN